MSLLKVIFLYSFPMNLHNFIGQPLRRSDYKPTTFGGEVGFEVGGGPQEDFVIKVVVRLRDEPLRVMDWQVKQGVAFTAKGSQADGGGLCAVANHHAVAFAEEL